MGFTTDKVLQFGCMFLELRKGDIELATFPDASHIFLTCGLAPESEDMLRVLAAIKRDIAPQRDNIPKPFGQFRSRWKYLVVGIGPVMGVRLPLRSLSALLRKRTCNGRAMITFIT